MRSLQRLTAAARTDWRAMAGVFLDKFWRMCQDNALGDRGAFERRFDEYFKAKQLDGILPNRRRSVAEAAFQRYNPSQPKAILDHGRATRTKADIVGFYEYVTSKSAPHDFFEPDSPGEKNSNQNTLIVEQFVGRNYNCFSVYADYLDDRKLVAKQGLSEIKESDLKFFVKDQDVGFFFGKDKCLELQLYWKGNVYLCGTRIYLIAHEVFNRYDVRIHGVDPLMISLVQVDDGYVGFETVAGKSRIGGRRIFVTTGSLCSERVKWLKEPDKACALIRTHFGRDG